MTLTSIFRLKIFSVIPLIVFEYAKKHNTKKVTCLTKDNIIKMIDGTFHAAFDRIAKEYQDIKAEHYIVDIGMARVATEPEFFSYFFVQCPSSFNSLRVLIVDFVSTKLSNIFFTNSASFSFTTGMNLR